MRTFIFDIRSILADRTPFSHRIRRCCWRALPSWVKLRLGSRRAAVIKRAVEDTVRRLTAPQTPLPTAAAAKVFTLVYDINAQRGQKFDVSTSIEAPDGEFLGEIGLATGFGGAPNLDLEATYHHFTVCIKEQYYAGALEVWLFDRDSTLTTTFIVMTPAWFSDPTKRTDLNPLGHQVLGVEGITFVLQCGQSDLVAHCRISEVTLRPPTIGAFLMGVLGEGYHLVPPP